MCGSSSNDLAKPITPRSMSRRRYGFWLLLCSLPIVATPLVGLAQPTPGPPNPVSPETATRRTEIQKVEQSLAKIADRGAAVFFLARRYAQVGDLDKALSLLKECIALDQGFDPGDLPQFEALHSNPEFQAMVALIRWVKR
jgi:hypothetical protein